jgi:hypothetical protein
MALTEEQVKEITSELEIGMICFYHRPTGAIESHPDPNDAYFEAEPWQEVIDKIEADWDNYITFEKMNSREAFRVMENFADSIPDIGDRSKALERLARRKPFGQFKDYIESSPFRQDWFDFRTQAYIEFVKEQVEDD